MQCCTLLRYTRPDQIDDDDDQERPRYDSDPCQVGRVGTLECLREEAETE